MTTGDWREALKVAFKEATCENEEATLQKPGKAGMEVLLTANAPGLKVTSDIISEVYEDSFMEDHASFDEPQFMSFIEAVAEKCKPEFVAEDGGSSPDGEEELAVAIANLADTIATRLESKQYPSLLPDELVTELERTTAKEALELTDKIEFVEMEAFIQNKRDIDLCADFFQGEESHNVKVAKWSQRFHYTYQRMFLLEKSLEEKRLRHKILDGVFLPLIEIPVNATKEEREEWEEARKSMGQCNCLESFSRDLWSQWDELVESGMVEDSDRKKKFEELMHATYYPTLCEIQSKAVVKHRVDIDIKCHGVWFVRPVC